MSKNLNFCFTKIKSLSSPEHNHSRPFSDPSSLLFNSLYEDTNATSTPDISTVFASRRFFFSSPGRSNSIIDSSIDSTSSSASLNQPENEFRSIAVATYSLNPFMDFRRSMQEMVEARGIHDVQENWDYLHELLMCYLSLNPKNTHKFIVGAFADLLVALMIAAPEYGSRKSPFPDRNRKMTRKK